MKERLGAGGLVSGGGVAVSTGGLRGVDGGALVGDIGDESVDVVSGVLGGLDPAVGESDHEASGNNTVGILCLGLLEVGLAVVVSVGKVWSGLGLHRDAHFTLWCTFTNQSGWWSGMSLPRM